jgi:phenylacetate-CoA ligase
MSLDAGGLYGAFHRRVIYPIWSRKDGDYALDYLREFERTQYLSPERLRELQWERLQRLVRHAYDRCPYYRERWGAAGIGPDDLRGFEDFARLPLVSKRDIQERAEDMARDDLPRDRLVQNRTGGSTGEPLVFYLDRDRVRSRAASSIRHDRWAGKDIGTLYASIWGHRRDHVPLSTAWAAFRERWIYRILSLDASSLSAGTLREFTDRLRRARPEVYVAYANAIYLLARFLREENIRDVPRPRAIIATAEVLEPDRRALIESVFGCPVFDRYGCREVSIIASECAEHDGLHLNAEGLYVEILKDGRPAAAGEPGEVVVTDLLNTGMPLIRYRIRDLASPVEGVCRCGRGLPRIRMAGGRVTDFISTPDGRIVSGASLTIFLVANTPGLRQAQLRQQRRAEVIIRVVRGPQYTPASEEYLTRTAAEMLGNAVRIRVEPVDEIAPSGSGKHLFCVSEVDPLG